MRKKLLLLFVGMCSMFSTSYAFDYGEYVYTRDGRVKVTGQANLVTNGNFAVTDVTASGFGWTSSTGGAVDTELMSVETAVGPNGENAVMSNSVTDNIIMQAIPFTAGASYVLSFQVKGPEATFCTDVATNNNRILAYAVKDAGGELTADNNYQEFSAVDAIYTTWNTINWSFSDTSGENGYIIIQIENPTAQTYFTNFQLYQADVVGDDREVTEYIEYAESLISSGQFATDNAGYADAVGQIKEYMAVDPTMFDTEAGVEEILNSLKEREALYLDENGADMSSYISNFSIAEWSKFNNGDGVTSRGDWVFTGASTRWGHATDAEFANYSYPNSFNLGWGQVTLTKAGLKAGKYMFAIDAYATKYATGKTSSGSRDYYVANYTHNTTGAYVFFGDTKVEIDTLPNYAAGTYVVYGELAEGDTLKAGIYFPGYESGGGTFRFGNAQLRILGVSAEDLANEQLLADAYVQQTQLALRLQYAAEDIAGTLPWGKTALQEAMATYQAVYDASTAIINPADGSLAEGKTYADIPEAYDDTLLAAVRAMNSARNAFADTNAPYSNLAEYVPEAEEILNAEVNANASAETRTALTNEIAESKALIAAVTAETDSANFVNAFAELQAAVVAFTESTASYQNPSSVAIVNADMKDNGGQKSGKCTGWQCEFESGSGIMQFGSDDRFLFGYKAYASRGSGSAPRNKIYQQVTVTKAGVYEFFFQAYACSSNSANYNGFWNGLSGEDSIRSANIKVYFGPTDNPTKVDILTTQTTFGNNLWVADEVRDYVIQYVKTTEGEEVLEFGMDASRNGQNDDGTNILGNGNGCNLYGFGSSRIYYYGSEETYKTGVEKITGEAINATDAVYSISGVKVGKVSDKLSRGIYLVKGKKFVVK